VLAALALLADWQEDEGLRAAVARLPEDFARALAATGRRSPERLVRANSLFVLGRGPGFAIANEMALKFKETCGSMPRATARRRCCTGRRRWCRRSSRCWRSASRMPPSRR
jgi:fructoselysine-6-P-deglycase FrlB-like protein